MKPSHARLCQRFSSHWLPRARCRLSQPVVRTDPGRRAGEQDHRRQGKGAGAGAPQRRHRPQPEQRRLSQPLRLNLDPQKRESRHEPGFGAFAAPRSYSGARTSTSARPTSWSATCPRPRSTWSALDKRCPCSEFSDLKKVISEYFADKAQVIRMGGCDSPRGSAPRGLAPRSCRPGGQRARLACEAGALRRHLSARGRTLRDREPHMVGERLQGVFKQPFVIVESASARAAVSAPKPWRRAVDGYSFGVTTVRYSCSPPMLSRKTPFDPWRDTSR